MPISPSSASRRLQGWAHAGLALVAALALVPMTAGAQRGTLRQHIERRRAERRTHADGGLDDGANDARRAAIPANVRVVRDVAYGSDPKQRFDVYVPAGAEHAPVIFMVHGGGWRTGDKAGRAVVENKVAHWSQRGVIVISVDYRLLPDADPLEQARDVARALAAAQSRLAEWGGDAAKVTLMGHSAGAHLVALLAADPSLATRVGAQPWLGTVILDSAVLDVVAAMSRPHLPLYDAAFGRDTAFWREASPAAHLARGTAPLLMVCSSKRRDSCPAAMKLAAQARALDVRAEVLPEAKSHREINEQLGADAAYTSAVDRFLASLDPALARALISAAR